MIYIAIVFLVFVGWSVLSFSFSRAKAPEVAAEKSRIRLGVAEAISTVLLGLFALLVIFGALPLVIERFGLVFLHPRTMLIGGLLLAAYFVIKGLRVLLTAFAK